MNGLNGVNVASRPQEPDIGTVMAPGPGSVGLNVWVNSHKRKIAQHFAQVRIHLYTGDIFHLIEPPQDLHILAV